MKWLVWQLGWKLTERVVRGESSFVDIRLSRDKLFFRILLDLADIFHILIKITQLMAKRI